MCLSGADPELWRSSLLAFLEFEMKTRGVALSGPNPRGPGEPRVAVDLVWVQLLMPDPFLSNDSAQETVPQGSDFPHLSLWLLGPGPVPFPKCLLV